MLGWRWEAVRGEEGLPEGGGTAVATPVAAAASGEAVVEAREEVVAKAGVREEARARARDEVVAMAMAKVKASEGEVAKAGASEWEMTMAKASSAWVVRNARTGDAVVSEDVRVAMHKEADETAAAKAVADQGELERELERAVVIHVQAAAETAREAAVKMARAAIRSALLSPLAACLK